MAEDKKSSNQMWGGRFASGPAAIMEEINASIGFDKKLYAQDIRGSLAHAEMLAIRAAAEAIGEDRLTDCDLWVTLEPCAMCAGAIAHARIARLYYGAPDPKGGAVEHGPRLFTQPTIHHRPEIYPGIGEGEAARLLRNFFATRR